MEFRNLANLDLQDLVSVFNLSFSDYLIPFHLTLEQLTSKMDNEKIDVSLSVGAFQSGRIVGFILYAEKIEGEKHMIYNAGTGVIPEYRRQGLVRKMHEYILPILQNRKANLLTLEVIEGNEPAIRAYTQLGFTISRKLLCFRGNIESKEVDSDILIQQMDDFQWERFISFWDIEPSWQNSAMVLERMQKDSIILGAYMESELVGYTVFNPMSGKVYQVAISKDHRRKGIGRKLFNVIQQMSGSLPVSINNVDDSSQNTSRFLMAMGLKNWVSQFEMVATQFSNLND